MFYISILKLVLIKILIVLIFFIEIKGFFIFSGVKYMNLTLWVIFCGLINTHFLEVDTVFSQFAFSSSITEHFDVYGLLQLARKSFPLCMRQLHGKLRQDHKLKHHGRLQYVLFLKGIGVTMEDVMTMWREEWARVEPEKVINKYCLSTYF